MLSEIARFSRTDLPANLPLPGHGYAGNMLSELSIRQLEPSTSTKVHARLLAIIKLTPPPIVPLRGVPSLFLALPRPSLSPPSCCFVAAIAPADENDLIEHNRTVIGTQWLRFVTRARPTKMVRALVIRSEPCPQRQLARAQSPSMT